MKESVLLTDREVFGPPRPVNQRYGSGSFHHHAKKQEKPLVLLFCDFFVTFYLRRMMYHKCNNLSKKVIRAVTLKKEPVFRKVIPET
jgi:hypothetical protein